MTKWTRSATWATAGALGIGFLLGGAVAKDSSLFGQTVAAWVQAIGAIAAIASGFALASCQRAVAQKDAGKAAGLVTAGAFNRVTDRMEAMILHAKGRTALALRGEQAREIVAALSELNLGTLPTDLIAPVAEMRAALVAINARIDEIYATEGPKRRRKDERVARLHSSILVLAEARAKFVKSYPAIKLDDLPSETGGLVLAAAGNVG